MSFLKWLGVHWRSVFMVLVPIVFLPLVFMESPSDDPEDENMLKCGYVLVFMACYWVLEIIPLPVTALAPIGLLPILGVMKTEDVVAEYFPDTTVLALGGLFIAIGVEQSHLHRRIALTVLNVVGTSERRLMLGFMMTTAFLSMWVSNVATTAMMVPIVKVLLQELEISGHEESGEEGQKEDVEKEAKKMSSLRNMLFLSVAYSATVGGTGTLTATGTNIVFAGFMNQVSKGKSKINFASWMIYTAPCMITCLVIIWVFLQFRYLGFRSSSDNSSKEVMEHRRRRAKEVIHKEIESLGPITYHEISVLFLLLLLVGAWFSRDSKIFPGWIDLFLREETQLLQDDPVCLKNCSFSEQDVIVPAVSNATPGIIIILLMFMLPANMPTWGTMTRGPALVDWDTVNSKLPWGLLLLWGGGFALSKATQVSGLSRFLGQKLVVLEFLETRFLILAVCALTATATEFTSNVATASILMPVLYDLAITLDLNPIYLMLPAIQATSYAFMFPVSTSVNTIVYLASGIPIPEMVKTGFTLNIMCLLVNFACINTYGIAMFDLHTFPDWANSTRTR